MIEDRLDIGTVGVLQNITTPALGFLNERLAEVVSHKTEDGLGDYSVKIFGWIHPLDKARQFLDVEPTRWWGTCSIQLHQIRRIDDPDKDKSANNKKERQVS